MCPLYGETRGKIVLFHVRHLVTLFFKLPCMRIRHFRTNGPRDSSYSLLQEVTLKGQVGGHAGRSFGNVVTRYIRSLRSGLLAPAIIAKEL